MKVCKRCGEDKPRSEYYRHPTTRDRLFARCKDCVKDKQLSYYESNRDIVLRRQKLYEARPQVRRRRVEQVARWTSMNTEKRRAHMAVRYAKKRGRLVPEPCEVCDITEVDAHHDDYSKPLAVRWLCRPHHAAHHKALRRAAKAAQGVPQ